MNFQSGAKWGFGSMGPLRKFSWLAMEFGEVPITLSVFLILVSHPIAIRVRREGGISV